MPEQVFAATANASASDAAAKARYSRTCTWRLTRMEQPTLSRTARRWGSGSRTALPRIVADELERGLVARKVGARTGDEKYGDQDTDGSHSCVVSSTLCARLARRPD